MSKTVFLSDLRLPDFSQHLLNLFYTLPLFKLFLFPSISIDIASSKLISISSLQLLVALLPKALHFFASKIQQTVFNHSFHLLFLFTFCQFTTFCFFQFVLVITFFFSPSLQILSKLFLLLQQLIY